MSNNIYDILKKIESLEAPKKTNLTESKMTTVKELHNESKKEKQINKGTIAEAVAQVEQQLNEKYMGFKKLEKSIAASGDVKDPGAVAASIGRKKYGKEKFQKAAAAGKKLGETQVNELSPDTLTSYADKAKGQRNWAGGRAMAAAQGNQRADPEGKFDRLADKRAAGYNKAVSKGARDLDKSGQKSSWDYDTNPSPAALSRDKGMAEGAVEESGLQAYLGKKKYGEKGMAALQKAGREGASKEKMAMIRAKHDKMDEDNTGTVPPKHYGGTGPTGAQFDLYMQQRKEELAAQKPKNEDMLSAKQKEFAALAEPKDKITYADKIAGAKKGKKDESNKFIGNLMKARADGKDEADLDGDGDMEKVSKGVSTMREGWEEMQKYLDKKRGPESKGGEGKKAGTRYGGSAQKDDDDEETDGEGKPVEKKKGRPKGTGGGAKFSFKKPKD
jgi:hypothetical protein